MDCADPLFCAEPPPSRQSGYEQELLALWPVVQGLLLQTSQEMLREKQTVAALIGAKLEELLLLRDQLRAGLEQLEGRIDATREAMGAALASALACPPPSPAPHVLDPVVRSSQSLAL
jgi:hypothetical protein